MVKPKNRVKIALHVANNRDPSIIDIEPNRRKIKILEILYKIINVRDYSTLKNMVMVKNYE